MKPLIAVTLLALLSTASAQEHERIQAERARAEARYAESERECRARFVVSSCLEDAQATRRDALAKLRKQELALDQAERKQKAADRTAAIRAKQDAAPLPNQPLPMPPRASEPEAAVKAPPPNANIRQPKPVPPQPTAEELAANRARYEQRQIDAEKHREEVTKRNQERVAKKKPAAPLPVPAAPSAPN